MSQNGVETSTDKTNPHSREVEDKERHQSLEQKPETKRLAKTNGQQTPRRSKRCYKCVVAISTEQFQICPAKDSFCSKRGRNGHFQKPCRTTFVNYV